MRQPPGFIHSTFPHHICKLNKAIYGLKQSPRVWYTALTSHLHSIGFTTSSADPSLLIHRSPDHVIFLLLYVDDLLITGNSPSHITQVVQNLQEIFHIKTLGSPSTFLGLQIDNHSNSLFLHQSAYLQSILHSAGLNTCQPVATSFLSTKSLPADPLPFSNPHLYRKLAGSLQYLTLTRPDISFAVNLICQHMHAPSTTHYQQLLRILRFLKGTPSHGLIFRPDSLTLSIYADSDWAGDCSDRKSTTGFCFLLGTNLISWRVHKQNSVARSSTEAEYRAMASATTELIWLRRLLQDFGLLSPTPATLYCDNRSALAIATNPVLHSRTKHIEIDRHFVREQLQQNILQLQQVASIHQLADIFTKALPKHLFKRHMDNLTILARDRYLEGGS